MKPRVREQRVFFKLFIIIYKSSIIVHGLRKLFSVFLAKPVKIICLLNNFVGFFNIIFVLFKSLVAVIAEVKCRKNRTITGIKLLCALGGFSYVKSTSFATF